MMKAKLTLAALALVAAPTLALACPGHSKQVMSCADGMVWDDKSEACVTQTTS